MLSANWVRRVAIIPLFIAGHLFLSVGCGSSGNASPTEPTSLTISPDALQIPLGLTSSVRATATYRDGTSADLTSQVVWTAEPLGIASVSSNGYVRSISPGNAIVTASLGATTANASLQVLPPTLESTVHQPSKNQYIWFGPPAGEGEMRFFRSQFTVGSVAPQATLYLAGPRAATVFLNGNVVMSAAEARPAWQVAFMGAIADLSGKVTVGANTLAIATTGGSLLAVKVVPAAQGIDIAPIAEAGADWRGATAAPVGWENPSFDDHSWGAVTVIGGIEDNPLNFEGNADMELYQWPGYDGISPWLAHTVVPAKVVSTQGNVAEVYSGRTGATGFRVQMPSGGPQPSVVLDFRDEFSGRLILVSQTPVPVTVKITYGESLDELTTNPYLGAQTLVVPADGTAAGAKSGYRYAQVTFVAGPTMISLGGIYSDEVYYPVSHLGSFDSSDELLNRIWQVAEKTIHIGMQEHIWDAPKRDRKPYSGDGYVIGGAIGHTFADRTLLQSTMDALRLQAGSADVDDIPGYDAMWVLMLADYYLRYADIGYLQTEAASLKSLLATMEAEVGPGELFQFPPGAYPFFDWSQELEPPPVTEGASIGTHLEFILGFQQGAWLLQQLEDPNADHYSQLATQLQDSARQAFLDSTTNTYGQRWQINAMAILSGTATSDQVSSIWENVLSQPSPYWVTPFFNYFVLKAMTAAGHRKEALDLVRRYWGSMVNEGANCFWEAYDPSWPKDHFHLYLQADGVEGTFVSLCHGWGAGPLSFLNTEVAGIKPLTPGFSSVSIRPDLFDLTHVKVAEPTPRGIINLDVTSPTFSMALELPAGMTAQLSIPVPVGQTRVLLNGRMVTGMPAEGGTRLIVNVLGGAQYWLIVP